MNWCLCQCLAKLLLWQGIDHRWLAFHCHESKPAIGRIDFSVDLQASSSVFTALAKMTYQRHHEFNSVAQTVSFQEQYYFHNMKTTGRKKLNPTRIERMTLRKLNVAAERACAGISRSTTELGVPKGVCNISTHVYCDSEKLNSKVKYNDNRLSTRNGLL